MEHTTRQVFPDIGKHSIFDASDYRFLQAFCVQQTRKLWRSKERATNRLGAPLFECWWPVPREKIRADRILNIAVLTKAD